MSDHAVPVRNPKKLAAAIAGLAKNKDPRSGVKVSHEESVVLHRLGFVQDAPSLVSELQLTETGRAFFDEMLRTTRHMHGEKAKD